MINDHLIHFPDYFSFFISWWSIWEMFDLLSSQLFALALVDAALGTLFNILFSQVRSSRLADMSTLHRSCLEWRWWFSKDCWSFIPWAPTRANICCDAVNEAHTLPLKNIHHNMTSVCWPFALGSNFFSIRTRNHFIYPPSSFFSSR